MCKAKYDPDIPDLLKDAAAILAPTPQMTTTNCLRTQLRLILKLLDATIEWLAHTPCGG